MSMPKIADFRRAKVLRETTRFTAYEHPICGDESPIAILDKTSGVIHENTPFWDVEEDGVITAYLDDMAAGIAA